MVPFKVEVSSMVVASASRPVTASWREASPMMVLTVSTKELGLSESESSARARLKLEESVGSLSVAISSASRMPSVSASSGLVMKPSAPAAAIRGHGAAVKGSNHAMAINRFKSERRRGTLCLHRATSGNSITF